MKRSHAAILIFILAFSVGCQKETAAGNAGGGILHQTAGEIEKYYAIHPPASSALLAKASKALGASADQDPDSLLETQGATDSTLRQKGIEAMLQSLPIGENEYYSPETLKMASDPQRNAGIGMVLKKEKDGSYRVVDTLEGSAAHREEIPIGSILESVDGNPVSDMKGGLTEVVARIKGQEATSVQLTLNGKKYDVRRGGVPFKHFISSTWKIGNRKVEYVVLRSTLPGAAAELKNFLLASESRSAILLDLRKLYNGDFAETFRIADLFIENQPLGSLVIHGKEPEKFKASPDQFFTGPVFAITGKEPSAFSGILSHLLTLNPKAKVAGGKWDGTAFVARRIPLADGSQISITTGYVTDGEGTPFYKRGGTPNIVFDPGLPLFPPLESPHPEDRGQLKLMEMVKSEL